MIGVRKANAEDAKAVWEIRKLAILKQCKEHYPADLLQKWTDGSMDDQFVRLVEAHFYVATIDDDVVGTGMIDCNNGQIDGLAVRPDMMNHGIGKKMLTFLEDIALQSGLQKLTLDSTLNAIEFYRKCGFRGDRVGEYESPRGITLDCMPMTKLIGKGSE